jgi:tRNA threonylcarbamoyl adenosine modification protein (Sua5/YciO/YrdC/YwlC family)
MFLKLYEKNPDQRQIDKIVELLRDGGVIIYPTDTVYGMGCDITKARAVERVARIKGIKPEKAQFSFICSDLSHLSDYAKHVELGTHKEHKQKAQPFMRPARKKNIPKARKKWQAALDKL